LRVEGPGSGSRSTNTEAYNLFLQANFFYAHYNQADTERAIALYQQAISLDPKLALAWTKLSSAYMYETENGWVRVAEGNARARNAVERALAIDPNLADAHMVRGFAYQWIDWNWKAALAEYERAQELDPGSARLAAARAHVMALVSGQYDKAITANRQALLRDPVDVGAHVEAAYNFYYAGRPEESAAMWRKVLLMNPSLASAHAKLATALLLADKRAEALAAVEEESDESSRLSISPIVYWSLGRKAESDTALRSLETKFAATMAYNIAMTHAYRGESDPAIQWLDRAYRQRDDSMVTVKVEPLLRNLRSDSRYQVILVKMNLAD
jgi:tetratricopeptide (TPR) repeat protein